jgi:hypothetical protein
LKIAAVQADNEHAELYRQCCILESRIFVALATRSGRQGRSTRMQYGDLYR